MQTVKLTDDFDHEQKVRKGRARRVTAYLKNGGPNNDGVYTMSDDAAEAALTAGKGQLVDPPADQAPDTPPAPETGKAKPGKGDVTTHDNVRG